MRKVTNNLGATAHLELVNAYGKSVRKITIDNGKSANLPLFQRDQQLLGENGEQYFIYDGEGALDLSDCTKKYDFKNLSFQALDEYLQTKRTNARDLQACKDFCELWGKNLEKGFLAINPPHFEQLEAKILQGESTQCWYQKLF